MTWARVLQEVRQMRFSLELACTTTGHSCESSVTLRPVTVEVGVPLRSKIPETGETAVKR